MSRVADELLTSDEQPRSINSCGLSRHANFVGRFGRTFNSQFPRLWRESRFSGYLSNPWHRGSQPGWPSSNQLKMCFNLLRRPSHPICRGKLIFNMSPRFCLFLPFGKRTLKSEYIYEYIYISTNREIERRESLKPFNVRILSTFK
jgi:hypothetical protein